VAELELGVVVDVAGRVTRELSVTRGSENPERSPPGWASLARRSQSKYSKRVWSVRFVFRRNEPPRIQNPPS